MFEVVDGVRIELTTSALPNGIRKGSAPIVMEVLRTSPGFEDLWQLHWNTTAGVEWNSPGLFIANGMDSAEIAGLLTPPPPPPPAAPGAPPAPRSGGRGAPTNANHSPAYSIKVTVQPDGTYTVTNMRNKFSKTYAPRVR